MPRSLVIAYTYFPSQWIKPVPTQEPITAEQQKNENRLLQQFLQRYIAMSAGIRDG